MIEPVEARRLDRGDGTMLAYRRRDGAVPTFVFLPGYASDMDGAKAQALDQFAAERGIGMLRFDYAGTGLSEGKFKDGTIENWLGDALAVIDAQSGGPLILIGSSMGGWIALHVALARPDRVKGILTIAAAPDFTEWGYTEVEKAEIVEKGELVQPNLSGGDPWVTPRAFWESGQRLRVLDGPIAIDCPVRLVQGDSDVEVPVEIASRLLGALRSADVQLTIVKGGGHRLSEPREIALILRTAAGLLETP